MDGYARARSADTPGALPVVVRIAAGRLRRGRSAAGEAMGIATGGVVPEGADAVVQHERVVEHDNTDRDPERCCHREPTSARRAGTSSAGGLVVVAGGVRLGPAQIGALAAAGVAEVVCARRPRVAVLTTGTELRPPGSALGPGEVYEANGVMLAAQLAGRRRRGDAPRLRSPTTRTRTGGRSSRVSSTTCSSRRAASRSARTTSSAGSRPSSASRRSSGASPCGRASPSRSASAGTTLVFGLPGNPVSSLVGCELFVRPAVLALQGAADPGPRFAAGPARRDRRRGTRRATTCCAPASTVTDDGVVARAGRPARSRT